MTTTVTHTATVKPTKPGPRRTREYVACCDCGWQDTKSYYYPKYAEARADKHRRTA
jgi:hypothetical protein